MDSNVSKCRACGARILWIRTAKGKAMPCDPDRVRFRPAGGPETFVMPDGKVQRGKRGASGGAVGYVSHFATCPRADRFRHRDEDDERRYSGLIEEDLT